MLLRLCFQNHRSFRDEACLSLVPTSLKEEAKFYVSTEGADIQALPACILYGANASGKSNAIDALQYIGHVVKSSHSRWEPDEPILRFPFKLDKNSLSRTSRFVVDFVVSGVRYQFGFETSNEAFVSEWLYAFPRKTRQVWYERSYQTIKFGKFLRGNLSILQSLVRKNSLFLSTAAQNNNEQLISVYRFFSDLSFYGDLFQPGSGINIDVKRIGKIIEFLKFADIGIVDAKVEKESAPEEVQEIFKSIKSVFDKKNKINKKKNKEELKVRFNNVDDFDKISFGHKTKSGDVVFLDLSEESDGTIRLANLLAPILIVLETGGVLAIDELDASLHTLLASKIFEIFNTPEINTNGAQLIAATHDTNLLCSKSIRRDQIWFVEKDEHGASSIYPLSDFSTRRTDNLEKGYLDGRYGAVPFLGSVRSIRRKILGEET